MTDMVERVARAIFRERLTTTVRVLCDNGMIVGTSSIPPAIEAALDNVEVLLPVQWEAMKAMVRIGITEMREPTPEMIAAIGMIKDDTQITLADVKTAWGYAVDAALKESP